MGAKGIDHEALLDTYIRAYNKILDSRPTDMTAGLHLCRGNFKDGVHFSEGGYDRIAIKLFNEINVNCYYVGRLTSGVFKDDLSPMNFSQLEYDTDRAGTFEPLKFLPRNKSAVLGLITSKSPKVGLQQALSSVVSTH